MKQLNQPDWDKQRFVHQVFESIAPSYDKMNSVISFRMHKRWRRFAMEKMDVQSGQTALDVCCGTCDWTISIAEKVGDGGKVIGLDFSPNMLRIGQQKVQEAGLGQRVELVEGNAMELPYEDNSFDYATIGFALRNVPDPKRVLQEMRRVVKPGGKVVSLEISHPESWWFRPLFYLYFRHLMPLMGKWLARSYEQYKWLPQSLEGFPDRLTLERWMEELGFATVQSYPLTGGAAALHIGTK